jgi:hypothetical protein
MLARCCCERVVPGKRLNDHQHSGAHYKRSFMKSHMKPNPVSKNPHCATRVFSITNPIDSAKWMKRLACQLGF